MSHTESLFIYMIWPVNFMHYGRKGGFALFTLHYD